MRNHISAVLLVLVLAALVGDIMIRTCTVHAQSGAKVYIDTFFNNTNFKTKQVAIQGAEVVAISCGPEYCNILSK
jgi:hypothetical protein